MNRHTALDERDIQAGILAVAELAKHVLARLIDIQNIEKLAEEFDDDI